MAHQPTEAMSGQVAEPSACRPQVMSISNAAPADIDWSEDSRHLLYRLNRDNPEWLAYNVETRSPLPNDERPRDTPFPPLASLLADRGIDPALSSVSPSGQRAIYALPAASGSVFDIYILEGAAQRALKLGRITGAIGGYLWFPDETLALVYTVRPTPTTRIWLASTSQLTLEPYLPEDSSLVSLSQDGQWVLYIRGGRIHAVEFATGADIQLPDAIRAGLGYIWWRPDSSSFMYLAPHEDQVGYILSEFDLRLFKGRALYDQDLAVFPWYDPSAAMSPDRAKLAFIEAGTEPFSPPVGLRLLLLCP